MCERSEEDILKDFKGLFLNKKNIFSELREAHERKPFRVPDHPGNLSSKVCFVFSCPGQEELINNEVCSGQTGTNLNTLLTMLYAKSQYRDIFPSADRSYYGILNASDIVHFEALDDTTEADKEELNKTENTQRITDFLKQYENLSYIILFGDKAEKIKETIENYINSITKEDTDPTIHTIDGIYHLGHRGINHITRDLKNQEISDKNPQYKKSEERTKARLEVVAQTIIEAIDGKKNP